MPQAAPGWYPDPYDPSLERQWDGAAWTSESRAVTARPPASPTNWRRLGIVAGAVVLPVVGFFAGYAAHQSADTTEPKAVFGIAPASTTTASEPANVNVPGPSAPRGIDTAGIVAQQNLNMAADIVATVMHRHPGVVITRHDLEAVDPNFAFDVAGVRIGDPGIVGGAVVSTGIDQLPHAPRRVVLALPGNSACYYESVVEGGARQFGVARGAAAVSNCFVSEIPGGVPQVRPETKWTNAWPPATS